MTPTTPQAVLECFSKLTGIRIRVISHDMEAQAIEFLKHGFALSDLESVVGWTQTQIRSGKNGFSELSLQWRVLFGRRGAGDEWETFQSRLAMAQKTIRVRAPEKQIPTARTIDGAGNKIVVFDAAPPQDVEPIRTAALSGLADLRKQMKGA